MPDKPMTQMEIGNAHLRHIQARGQTAREVPAANRNAREWKDIEAELNTFGPADKALIQAEKELLKFKGLGRPKQSPLR
jgi:hypothetical protein